MAAFGRCKFSTNSATANRTADLVLNLVYNPVDPHLPPPQEKLEQDYKRILAEQFGIEFNHLFCLTNMPITRYATHLKLRREYEPYMELLENSFNAATVDQVMCRNLDQCWLGRWDLRL